LAIESACKPPLIMSCIAQPDSVCPRLHVPHTGLLPARTHLKYTAFDDALLILKQVLDILFGDMNNDVSVLYAMAVFPDEHALPGPQRKPAIDYWYGE